MSQDPLHGLTLEVILNRLVELYGWEEMARFVKIRCFSNDPRIKSSLAFLRRPPRARASDVWRISDPVCRRPVATRFRQSARHS